MSKEEAELALMEPQRDALSGGAAENERAVTEPSPPGPAPNITSPAPVPTPAADADATDVSEADLEHADPELEPMTSPTDAPETNGAVKLKIPEGDEKEQPERFTGLNKDELMRVASTPGWRRARWSLLVLFWFSWLGMLAGAVLLILRAPPCKELPTLNWWNQGPILHIRKIQEFSPAGNLRGVEERSDLLVQSGFRSLLLGPVHVAPKDEPMSLSFKEVSPQFGSLDQMKSLLHTAHETGLFIILDLTPNYLGSSPWFSNDSVSSIAERLKSDLVFWLSLGVDGVKLDDVDLVSLLVPSLWSDIRTIVQNWTDSRPHKRLVLGSCSLSSPAEVSSLLSDSGVDLLLSRVLHADLDATERAQTVLLLSSAHSPAQLLWSIEGGAQATEGGAQCDDLELMFLMSLPGTALIQDQIPQILTNPDQNQTQLLPPSPICPSLSSLSSLRSRERPLLVGDVWVVFNSSSALAFVRQWEQRERILLLFNFSPEHSFNLTLPEGGVALQRGRGQVLLRSEGEGPAEAELSELRVEPRQAVMIKI